MNQYRLKEQIFFYTKWIISLLMIIAFVVAVLYQNYLLATQLIVMIVILFISTLLIFFRIRTYTDDMIKVHQQQIKKIEASTHLFEQFMEKIPAVIGIHDENDRILYVNSAAKSFTTKENSIGLLFSDILPKELANKLTGLFDETKKSGHAEMTIEVEDLKSNEQHIFRAMAFVIEDEYQSSQIGTVYIDITKQYKDNLEIIKLQQVLDNSPVSIVITDVDGNIEYTNPSFTKTTGYAAEEAIGLNPKILKSDFHPEEDYVELWDTISHNQVWTGTFKNIKKNGEEYWESAIIAPVKGDDGKISNYFAIKQEITESIYLKEQLLEKEDERVENFEKTLDSFVTIVEDRDTYTGGHSQRVATYCKLIAQEMQCSHQECDLIYRAGVLHDIGKISTPDNVLLKPGKLTDLEYELIQEHVTTSYNILSGIPMYKDIADIVICHHERYDGKGYPKGVKGDDIPLLAHIMIIADAFDAMTTSRIYKSRKNVSEAIEDLIALSSKQFHPDVVKNAVEALSDVKIEDSINQLPTTDIEKERFAYFFRDQITKAYNSDYLTFLLSQNNNLKYVCINVLYLHNFGSYNEKYGWVEGDKFLNKFVDILIEKFPSTLVFRVYGDDFILLGKADLKININKLEQLDILQENEINISNHHIDLHKKSLTNFEELESMILDDIV